MVRPARQQAHQRYHSHCECWRWVCTNAGGSGAELLAIRCSLVQATMGFLLFGYDQGVMAGIISEWLL